MINERGAGTAVVSTILCFGWWCGGVGMVVQCSIYLAVLCAVGRACCRRFYLGWGVSWWAGGGYYIIIIKLYNKYQISVSRSSPPHNPARPTVTVHTELAPD